jgi:hypothetical protein
MKELGNKNWKNNEGIYASARVASGGVCII